MARRCSLGDRAMCVHFTSFGEDGEVCRACLAVCVVEDRKGVVATAADGGLVVPFSRPLLRMSNFEFSCDTGADALWLEVLAKATVGVVDVGCELWEGSQLQHRSLEAPFWEHRDRYGLEPEQSPVLECEMCIAKGLLSHDCSTVFDFLSAARGSGKSVSRSDEFQTRS